MEFFKRIFRRRKQFKPQPKELRIDGVKTTLTPTPDDAELAAQALLESMSDVRTDLQSDRKKYKDLQSDKRKRIKNAATHSGGIANPAEQLHDAAYYKELREKIKAAHESDKHAAMRYVAYVEEQLKLVQGSGFRVQDSGLRVQDSSNHDPLTVNHAPENIATLEHGLFKHQDTVEREGGELLRRWQKCLAECLIKQMVPDEKENEK